MLIKVKIFLAEKKRGVVKKKEDEFEVRVKSKPIKGEANREIVSLLANFFSLPEKKIKIIKGQKRRNKIIKIID